MPAVADVDVGRERDHAGCNSAWIAVVCFIPMPWPCPGLRQDMSVLGRGTQLLVFMQANASQFLTVQGTLRWWIQLTIFYSSVCSLAWNGRMVSRWRHWTWREFVVEFFKLLTRRLAERDGRKPTEIWVADLWVCSWTWSPRNTEFWQFDRDIWIVSHNLRLLYLVSHVWHCYIFKNHKTWSHISVQQGMQDSICEQSHCICR